LINSADWELTAGGFSFYTSEKLYQLTATGMKLNNKEGHINIRQVAIKPTLSQAAFAKRIKVQTDRLDMTFSNIDLTGVDFKKLINDNILEIKTASLQPLLRIFNDRTVAIDSSKAIVKYPHQSLTNLSFPFYIEKITVNNGAVFYKERARKSGLTGIPNFTQVNAVLNNVTNIAAKIKENDHLILKASTQFLGVALLNTEWRLPLDLKDTTFTVTGKLGPMDATVLNKITEPLAMASVNKGKINELTFNLKCTNYKGTGELTFLYNGLKVEVLKMSDDTLKRKALVSFLANTLIKNNNPSNDKIYIGSVDYKRDIQSSFFNLLWKSIFDGVKKTLIRN